jgi:hypothetical protein
MYALRASLLLASAADFIWRSVYQGEAKYHPTAAATSNPTPKAIHLFLLIAAPFAGRE